jgi:hypothetical protein
MSAFVDITGQRFGHYVAIRFIHGRRGRWFWLCRCDCGHRQRIGTSDLLRGRRKGCRRCRAIDNHLIDVTGQRFGRLFILKRAGSTPRGGSLWLCRCDCGKRRKVWSVALRQGLTRSCGCLAKDLFLRRVTKHGMSGTREHCSWLSMIQRCTYSEGISWQNYGGRGIRICQRWQGKHGFENFYTDMGPRPEGTSLDRIDVDGNYAPGNCRWATAEVQANNRRTSVHAVEEIGIG